ncbi:MAG: ParB/RepB/Spo0J family partition protein [Gammaproteobacteria bacterium]|nr:ParB/RepB/Spo0J family partition protein [Gammaproteobacteria bacterium]
MADDSPRKGLGRGLSALLGDDDTEFAALDKVRNARDVPIEYLSPNPFQPRHRFSDEAQESLVASIREHGILQPILVRRVAAVGDADGSYEIIAGERRWRAAQEARITRVPVLIRDFNDSEALEIALVENVQRVDLSPIEEAAGYQRLIDEFGHTQDALGQLIGRSRSHIANTLRLLNLPAEVRNMLDDGRLTAGHARALLGTENPIDVARQIVRDGLNVRQAERMKRTGSRKIPAEPPPKDADTLALEKNLSAALGLSVDIAHDAYKGGSVKIRYRTLEQLDEVCRRLIHPVLPGEE